MIVALFAAAVVAVPAPQAAPSAPTTTPAAKMQLSCHEAHAMIAAMNASRSAGAAPLSIQLTCQDGKAVSFSRAAPRPLIDSMPNLFTIPERCSGGQDKVVDRDGNVLPRKLADLPPGAVILTVDRKIDGCRVTTVLSGNVKPDDPNPSAQSGAMKAVGAPAKREDAPSNRR